MEKTSREYAEKLAEEMQPDIEGKNYTLYNMLAQEKRHNIVIGYLKAVEETNVKELREALVNLTSAVVSGKFNKEEEVNAALSLIEKESLSDRETLKISNEGKEKIMNVIKDFGNNSTDKELLKECMDLINYYQNNFFNINSNNINVKTQDLLTKLNKHLNHE